MPSLSTRTAPTGTTYSSQAQLDDLMLGPAPPVEPGPPPQPAYSATDAGTYSGAGAGYLPPEQQYAPAVTPEQRMPVGSGEVADASGSYSDPAVQQYPAYDGYVEPASAPPPATAPGRGHERPVAGTSDPRNVASANTGLPATSPGGASRPWYEGNPLDAVGAAASQVGQSIGIIPQSAGAQMLPGETEEILPPNVRGPGGGGGGVLSRGGGRGGSSAPPAAAAPPVNPSSASSVRRPGGRAPIITSPQARAQGQRSTPTGTVVRPGATLPQAPSSNSASLPRRMVSSAARPAQTSATVQAPRSRQQIVQGASAPPTSPAAAGGNPAATSSVTPPGAVYSGRPSLGTANATRTQTGRPSMGAAGQTVPASTAGSVRVPGRAIAQQQQTTAATPPASSSPWRRRVAIGGVGAGLVVGTNQAMNPRPDEVAVSPQQEDPGGTTPGNITPFPPVRQVSILQPDGSVTRGELPPGRSGGASAFGRVRLTADGAPESVTAVVAPLDSLAAAEARGEVPWQLTQPELDALIAGGLVAEADRAALQNRALLIPQTWAASLDPWFAPTGTAPLVDASVPWEIPPALAPADLPPTAPAASGHRGGDGGAWQNVGEGGWSGGGDWSGGGGGDWYGSDFAMPPTMPGFSGARSVLGDDFMAGFMVDGPFASRMGGGVPRSLRGRRGRRMRGRGVMPGAPFDGVGRNPAEAMNLERLRQMRDRRRGV